MKLPEVKKCCFCVPIRKGVITFGYINLILCLLSLPLLILMVVINQDVEKDEEHEATMLGDLPLSLAIIAVIVDIVIIVIQLIGAHNRKRLLLQIYFYAGIVLQLFMLVVEVIYFNHLDYLSNIVYLIGLAINIYQFFLVHNLIHYMKDDAANPNLSESKNLGVV